MSTTTNHINRAARRRVSQGKATMRVVIYCRISADPEGHEEGVTRQLKDCRAFCEAKGWTIVAEFVDDDRSASEYRTKVREGFVAMLALIDTGEVDAVVVYNMDRLVKDPRDLEALNERARMGTVNVSTLHGDLDLATGEGRFAARVLTASAAKHSDDASRRIKRQKAERRVQGKPPSGNAFGWKVERPNGTLAQDPAEAKIVRQMYDRVLDGEGIISIARWVNELGVTTKRGGTVWNSSQVSSILRAPRNAALTAHQGEIMGEGSWRPIVDRETWERVQAILETRANRWVHPPNTSLLTGLVRCECCGWPMRRKRQPRTDRWVMVCHAAVGRPNCGRVSLLADVIEDVVKGFAFAWTDSPKELMRLRSDDETDKAGADAQEAASITQRIDEVRAQMATDFGLSVEDGAAVLRTLNDRLNVLRAREVDVTTRVPDKVAKYLAQPGALRKAWEKMTPELKRAALVALFERRGVEVVVSPKIGTRSNRLGPDPRRVKVRPVR